MPANFATVKEWLVLLVLDWVKPAASTLPSASTATHLAASLGFAEVAAGR
jgi:hypothetical protein